MSEETREEPVKKVVFFGCPLDVDESDESVQEKISLIGSGREHDDPYAFIMDFLREELPSGLWEEIGSLDVPEWLRPVPPIEAESQIIVDNFVHLIDQDGCRTFAEMIGKHVIREIFPNIPCMVAVDHSLTGGVFKELAALYAPEGVSLIVLDSHTDAIPVSALSDAVNYDMETNPHSEYAPEDPFLKNRPESFNASTFIFHLLEEGIAVPENLYLLGISDYPEKRHFRVKDPRIKRYTGAFSRLKRMGVKMVTKTDLQRSPSKVKEILQDVDTPYTYISVDMDIGAGNAFDGVRFRNRRGLSESRLYALTGELRKILSEKTRLAGLDLTEMNARRAGAGLESGEDRTYRVGADLIKRLCFGME